MISSSFYRPVLVGISLVCYNLQVILTIDLGNTNVVFGLFKGKRLIREWRYPTEKLKIPNIKAKLSAVIIASVVPSLNRGLQKRIRKQFKRVPFFVTAENIPELKVRLKKKREIGADRVVDALAVYRLYGGPAIIVDFGTATTFDVVSERGEYLGGAIAPGIVLARDSLYEKAAKLPRIKISAPKGIIGKNTVSAMQSGLVFGYVAMMEGMVERLKKSLGAGKGTGVGKKPKVIATGGLAKLICKYTKVVDRIDTKLTLKGLQMIGEKLND